MPILNNKKLVSADFEQKFFAHFFKQFADFRANNFFLTSVSKIEAYEANSPLQKRFCDFSQRIFLRLDY